MQDNSLFNTLLQRQMPRTPQEQQPAPLPTVLPSSPAKIPPQVKRWDNAQQIQDAYANNWSPNPILLRALLGHR